MGKLNELAVVVKEKKNHLMIPAVGLMSGAMALPVFANDAGASGNITADMTTALQSAFGAVKTDVVSIIVTALPYALGIMAIGLALSIGIRFFSQMSKKK